MKDLENVALVNMAGNATSAFLFFALNFSARIACNCYGLNCVSPSNLHDEDLTPGTSDCDCLWRQGLGRYDYVKMRY